MKRVTERRTINEIYDGVGISFFENILSHAKTWHNRRQNIKCGTILAFLILIMYLFYRKLPRSESHLFARKLHEW